MDASRQNLHRPPGGGPVRRTLRRNCWLPTACRLSWLAALAGSRAFGEPETPSSRVTLRVACMQSVASNLNRNDALASIKVLGRTVAARRNLDFNVEPTIYETVAEAQHDLEKRTLDLIVMTSADYLKLEALGKDLEPVFMPSYARKSAKEYLLVTAKGASPGLASLHGKRLLLLQSRGANLGQAWLDLHLHSEKLDLTEKFFGSVQVVSKASAAILPVFFGQAEACIVNRESFEISTELNPQLGARLQVLTNSPSYLESVVCLRRSFESNRADVIAALAEMHQFPDGQQIFTLFTISSISPFQETALTSVRQLLTEWHKLNGVKL
jgi:ABC-type phosphate/phosphonate transport system substrate-binding protein